MSGRRAIGIAAALFGLAAAGVLADVVVLKGGTVIQLKQPVVRRGSTAYITRADGTLLSVPVSEIDRDATAAANHAAAAAAPAAPAPAAATNPADAARVVKDGQKAKVKITDADVSHPLDMADIAGEDKDAKKTESAGMARVEVADYTREKNGASLVVKGSLRNPGQGTAENVRLAVTAVDEKGQSIDGVNATLSKGNVDSGTTVEFMATLNVGDRNIAAVKFQPQWTVPKPPPSAAPAPGARPAAGAPGAAGAAVAAPTPAPTPYGLGSLYAAPVANATTETPSDSHTGYLPSVSSPDNQPKPPTP
jgi:hypothetical protein